MRCTRSGLASRHSLVLICSAPTGAPWLSYAMKSRTKRPMFIVWYVPGAVAANSKTAFAAVNGGTVNPTTNAWCAVSVRSTVYRSGAGAGCACAIAAGMTAAIAMPYRIRWRPTEIITDGITVPRSVLGRRRHEDPGIHLRVGVDVAVLLFLCQLPARIRLDGLRQPAMRDLHVVVKAIVTHLGRVPAVRRKAPDVQQSLFVDPYLRGPQIARRRPDHVHRPPLPRVFAHAGGRIMLGVQRCERLLGRLRVHIESHDQQDVAARNPVRGAVTLDDEQRVAGVDRHRVARGALDVDPQMARKQG